MWSVAANWSEGRVPEASDVACIGSGATVRVTGSGNVVGTVQGEGTLEVVGSLEVASGFEPSSLHGLAISGGTLTGVASVEVTGTLSWEYGGYEGSGELVVGSGASGTWGDVWIGGSGVVRNEGTVTLGTGTFTMTETARFVNAGTFKANAESTPPVFRVYKGSPSILNTGLFEKTAGTGRTEIGIPLESEGTIDGASGELRFFEKTEVMLGSSVLEGAIENFATTTAGDLKASHATLELTGGSFSVTSGSTATVGALGLGPGGVAGAGTVDVSGSLTTGSYGLMKGSSRTVLLPGATASLGQMYLEESAWFVVEGVATFAENDFSMSGTSVLDVVGTFKANSESYVPLIRVESGSPKIVNSGLFEKTAGTGHVEVQPDFANLGSIKSVTGKLEILNPVSAEQSTQWGGRNPSADGPPPPECDDPVGCATGNFSEKQTDLAVGGRGVGLVWTRYYNSQAAATGNTKGMFGYGWSSSFSDHLVLEKASTEKPIAQAVLYQADGSTVPFTESGGKYTAPEWSQDTLTGSEAKGYTLMLADQTTYKFNGSKGRLESVADRNGNATTFTYTGAGRLEKITDPAGRKITLAYNSEGLVESAKDPMGRTVKYAYEEYELAGVTEPGETEKRWQFKYDGSHELTTMTDGRGGKIVNEYNGAHQVVSQEDPAEHTSSFEYEPFETTITNKATGAVTVERFDSNDLPFSISRGYGTASETTETFAYNSQNELLSVTDGNGHTTKYGYNSSGDRTSMVNADEQETKWEYDGTHDVTSVTTPGGETTTIKRDSQGNAEAIERPISGKTQVTKYAYDSHGNLEKVTNPVEQTWVYGHDNAGDRTAETSPETEKRTLGYNEDSQEVWTVSPRGNASGELTKYMTGIERDERGRPLKIADPLGHTTKYTYDADGNLETITDGNGHKTTYTYNADNEPTKVKEPNGTVTETEYDGAGDVIAQVDGNKHTTKYVRNILGEVTEVVDPLSRKTTKEYDGAGNLTTLTDPLSRTTTYVYDPANRLKEVTYSDGKTHSVKYEYNADGDRTSMIDGTGTTSYTYDKLDRLTEVGEPHGLNTSYEYNLAYQQTKITYPSGKAVSRAYDKDGRLQKVTDFAEHAMTFSYDKDSDLTATVFPSGSKGEDTYTYNAAGQTIEAKVGATEKDTITYARDGDGQVSATTEKGLPGEEHHTDTYNEENRLLKAGSGHEWEYDAAGQPTKVWTIALAYDAGGEIQTKYGYTYNEAGERTKYAPTKGPATTYTYDQAGNLTAVNRSAEGSIRLINDTYAYNGDGLRTAEASPAGGTKYMAWDNTQPTPVLIYDGKNSYIYGPEELPIEEVNTEGRALYLHHDQQGSTRLTTNSSGTKEAAYTYGPYGELIASAGTATTALGYDGQYMNSDTGLIYLHAREYDPATAQFLSVDPLFEGTNTPAHATLVQYVAAAMRSASGSGWYVYANDNPLNNYDPTGLFTLGICVHGEVNFIIHIGASGCVQGSTSGEIGGTLAGSAGLAQGAGAGATVGPQISNASHISELSGPFANTGGQLGVGPDISLEAFGAPGACGPVVGGGFSAGAGVGVSRWVGGSYTGTWSVSF